MIPPCAGVLVAGAVLLLGPLRAGAQTARLDSLFAPLRSSVAPGCAAGASIGGGTVYETAAGMANLEFANPITPTTVFPVASVSKQFTAFAVMLLAREGRLSLDDDIRKHIPELPDFGHVITVRHLLTHTSGLRDQFELIRVARGRLFWYHVGKTDALEIVRSQRTLNHAPGADYMYSATGYMLAALIVERVSGISFRAFTQQRIFAPLGMTHTQFQDDYTSVMPNRAISYYRTRNEWHWMMPNYDVVGPTGMVSTVADLLKWEANMDQPRVGDAEMFAAMAANTRLASGDSTGYGMGLFVERYRGTPSINHGGDDIGYHAATARFPAFGLAVIVLCNSNDADAGELLNGIADVLLAGRLAPAEPEPTARAVVLRTRLERYAGLYADDLGRPLYISLHGDSLMLGERTGPLLLPQTERRFRRADGRTEYEFLADGGVVAMRPYFPFRVAYARAQPARHTPERLTSYAGTYVSDELGSSYDITVDGATLTMKTRWGPPQPLRAVHADYFEGADGVRFTRDKNGVVNGFLIQGVRLRNLRFARVR